MPDFSRFDGSDRIPRPGQLQFLRELDANWAKWNAFAGVLPTGSGKSGIAKSIQEAAGADILTISNPLVTQYAGDYPETNFLKGKTHYDCKSGVSCKTWQDCGFGACEGCPYTASKERAAAGEPTFFNPMSYYYFKLSSGTKGSPNLVIDEAHQLPGMVSMLTGKRFKRSEYAFSEKVCNELYFIAWGKDQLIRLDSLASIYYKRNDIEKLAKVKNEIESLALLLEGIQENPQNYVLWIDKDPGGKGAGKRSETFLNVRPIFPPRFLMNRIVGGKKLILLSGTLFDHDIKQITDQGVYKIEQNSPIPKKQRLIHCLPAPFKVNWQTDPKQLADYIKQFLKPGVNTLIHTTYSLSKKLAPYMPKNVIINSQEDKEEKIEEFKQQGGIFLAAGCAEGIDFKGDYARLNIIPKLSFPDLKDSVVQKRKALQDGNEWFALETLKVTIQQAGRTTRGADDWSDTLVLDPNFYPLVKRYWSKLPRYFTEAIVPPEKSVYTTRNAG